MAAHVGGHYRRPALGSGHDGPEPDPDQRREIAARGLRLPGDGRVLRGQPAALPALAQTLDALPDRIGRFQRVGALQGGDGAVQIAAFVEHRRQA